MKSKDILLRALRAYRHNTNLIATDIDGKRKNDQEDRNAKRRKILQEQAMELEDIVENTTEIKDLPLEMLFKILVFLDGDAMAAFAATDKKARVTFSDPTATKFILGKRLREIYGIQKDDANLVLSELLKKKFQPQWLRLFSQIEKDLNSQQNKNVLISWEIVKFINGMGYKNEKMFLERKLKYFKTENKERLLQYAAKTNRVWLLEYILERRDKWSMPSSGTLINIMTVAVNSNSVASIMYLMKHNKKTGSLIPDEYIYSFVILSLVIGNYDTAKIIIDLSGLKPDYFETQMKDVHFLFNLDTMARKGDIEMAKILVEKMGFNKRTSGNHFHSFLEKAARRGRVDFIKYFVNTFEINPSRDRIWAFEILNHAESMPINTLQYILYDYFGNHFKIEFDDDEYIDLENAEETLSRRMEEESTTTG